MTMAGGHLIVLSTYLQLAPKWIVSLALLVAGAVDAEKQYRIALASALMVSLSLEMAWTWFFPEALSHRAAGGCLALSTLFQGLAASTSLGGGASPTANFALLAAAGCACIPVNQLGALWRLGQPSAARYRIAGWIMAVSLGSLALLWPGAARPSVAIPLLSAYPCYVAARLLRSGRAAPAADRGGADGAGGARARGGVAASTAAAFVFFHVVVGTNAEAVNDMAIGHRVRAELGKGAAGLALTNNASVLLSQLLALGSEFGISRGDETRRHLIFLAVWSACQVLRGFGSRFIVGSSALAHQLVGGFVFLDKYSGPLGQAALEQAGMELLRGGAVDAGGAVPAPFLISLRMASFKYERPMWDILLVHEARWWLPLPAVTALLTAVGGVYVFTMLTTAAEKEKAG